MKSLFRTMCCVALIASQVLALAPSVQAQTCDFNGVLNGIYGQLQEARAILSSAGGVWTMQSANQPLNNAKRLAGSYPFSNLYPGLASDLHRGIEKAKTQVMWNDRGDAIEAVNRVMFKIERARGNPGTYARSNRRGGLGSSSGSHTAAWVAAPIIAGIGGLLVGIFNNFHIIHWGQVLHP